MIKIKVTNPYYDKTFTIDYEIKKFERMFRNHVNAVGYVEFHDTNGTLVIISPDKFASVEIWGGVRSED